MRPTIQVWPLPSLTQPEFEELFNDIVRTCQKIERLAVKDQNDLIVGFPKDLMEYGLGLDIIVQVFVPLVIPAQNLNAGENQTHCYKVTQTIGETVRNFFYRHNLTPRIQCQGSVLPWTIDV